jgi:glycosyltransferase involved in cell wall biosynthesis
VMERLSFGNYILGVGRPFWGNAIKRFDSRLSYYDCSDDYSASPRLVGNREMLKKLEEELARSVDLIFCSSQKLKEDKSVHNKNCFLVPNGVDSSSLINQPSDKDIPSELKKIKKPILGYIGMIDERFDLRTLLELARTRNDWSIVLVGPIVSSRFSSGLRQFPTIYCLGKKNFEELPRYLRAFDVCLIPFRIDAFTERIFPTKFHQYLAAGKPVVSSPLPDLQAFRPWVDFYADAKEMEEKIDRAIREDSEEKASERRRIAAENTWDERVKSMIETLNTNLGKK